MVRSNSRAAVSSCPCVCCRVGCITSQSCVSTARTCGGGRGVCDAGAGGGREAAGCRRRRRRRWSCVASPALSHSGAFMTTAAVRARPVAVTAAAARTSCTPHTPPSSTHSPTRWSFVVCARVPTEEYRTAVGGVVGCAGVRCRLCRRLRMCTRASGRRTS
jgi:hypothetical protein